MQTKTYYITTFGCQANISDSERIAGALESFGVKHAKNEEQSDILIFNSCSVRQSAEDRIFGLNKKIKELKTKNPKLKIALTGCMTHYDANLLKTRLPYIDVIFRIKELAKLPEILNLALKNQPPIIQEYLSFTPKYESKFKGYIPISYGCNNFCSYCVVPYARGREVSRPAKEIISEAKNLAKNYKEIWLLGQNVNSYRCNFQFSISNFQTKSISQISEQNSKPKIINFAELLKITNNVPGNFWLRFTSPHPKDFSDDLIKTMTECEKFGHYLNLPVQSGDNEILKKMNRNYDRDYYIELVQKIKKAIPDISLSTDTIVGFPGETEKQFMNTVKLYKDIEFDMAYISEYSERPSTLAAKIFKDNISKSEKTRRKKYLTEILAESSLKNNKQLIGKTLEVLIDEEKNGRFFGRTAGNKVVELLNRDSIFKIGVFKKVKITSANPWKLFGKI